MKEASKEDMALLLRAIARGDLKRVQSVCGSNFETHPLSNDFIGAWVPEKGPIPRLLDTTRKWLKEKEKTT